MPTIYDNINSLLSTGLNRTLEASTRADFCVGYFNLRGWKEVAEKIDALSGATVSEKDEERHRVCRLLVGMQKMPEEILREYFRHIDEFALDNSEASKLRRKIAEEFKTQLTIGTPTEADERGLRRLSRQMKDGKVTVKLHLRYALHAKLYLGERRNPSEQKELGFESTSFANAALAVLNSTLFRWFLTTYSDCRNLNRREVVGFPIDIARLVAEERRNLDRLARLLSESLIDTSEVRSMRFGETVLDIQCIIPKFFKPIIDEIDKVLAKHYGFTDEELDFIINYDIKYRMGRELDDHTDHSDGDQSLQVSGKESKKEKARKPKGNPLLSGGPLFD